MVKTFQHIPTSRPSTPLLDQASLPADLRALDKSQLSQLADELREYLLYSVGQSGGHFGAGLGVVELTVVLHYLYNTPDDLLLWDVGHQAYPHKILTGRREQLHTIRQQHGLAAFPARDESVYDAFGVGHSSTSISAGLGMALAQAVKTSDVAKNRVVAVIGDGAMTGGMAFEALNHAAHSRANLLVILNDNNMSISHNVGGLANYFARVWASKLYISLRKGGKKVLASMPKTWDFVRRTEESMKGLVSPDTLFESLGFNYIGPMDGHNIDELLHTIENMRDLEGPQLLHIMTTKGKGFAPAEADPVGFHAINKIEAPVPEVTERAAASPSYSAVFGQWLCDMAAQDESLMAITPAMSDGSGMQEFAEQFPQRFHDVAIAEQHALTLAAGMACEGAKPVVAIYSTFLQRGYDQLVHDIALQNLDVTFGIDRAGLVGADGPTHAGVFDYAFMRCLPNMVLMAPSDENECRQMLYTAYQFPGPAAVRYPRGTGTGSIIDADMTLLEIGKANCLRTTTAQNGEAKVALLAFGSMVEPCRKVAEAIGATLLDMRFIKPLDEEKVSELAQSHDLLVTIEEHQISGGAGSAVNEFLNKKGLVVPVLNLGLPDQFVEHGKPQELLSGLGLDSAGINHSVGLRAEQLGLRLSKKVGIL